MLIYNQGVTSGLARREGGKLPVRKGKLEAATDYRKQESAQNCEYNFKSLPKNK